MVARPDRPRRVRIAVAVGALIVLLVILYNLARFYTDVLWFREIGLTSVLWTSLRTQVLVGAAVGIGFGAIVWVNLYLAERLAPAYWAAALSVSRHDPLDQVRAQLRPFVRWVRGALALLIALFAGAAASSTWRTYLLWANRVAFPNRDPQFHLNVGFFVFELPFYGDVLGWIWGALLLALVLSAVAHYFYGSFDPARGWRGVAPSALAHLSVLLGLVALTRAGQYWLGRYSLDLSSRGVVTGASYTDVHAELPALTLLAAISVLSAAMFLANIRVRRLSLPLAAIGIWIFISVVAGAVWPLFVQRFSVKPQELQRESRYIARNIQATRDAFGLDHVQDRSFPASTALTSNQVDANRAVLGNVRLWDPDILQRVYAQLQAIQLYYHFPDVDVDRYPIGGKERQVLLSTREIALQDLPSRTWLNLHLRYTHGYGIVASLANSSTSAGEPAFLVKGVPPRVVPDAGSLDASQPRVYFGETFSPSQYSIVNSGQSELDYPSGNGTVNFHYSGPGGIPIGGLATRIAFALREGDPNLVLSSLIRPDSKILIYRNVRDRVHRAAPFLYLDGDPYPAVIDGRIDWIVDAYTATDLYPYSERIDAGRALSGPSQVARLHGRINYVRNSVKVVVDAYTGKMTFYTVPGVRDPLLEAWKKAFPALFTSRPPPAALQAHFRYPEDLFAVQSEVWSLYHMSKPAEFYSKRDQWAIPDNPQNLGAAFAGLPPKVPPTYLLFRLPGEGRQEFVLARPYTPRTRNNMVAELVARNDPPHYGQLVTLRFGDRFVQGPIQVDNLINQDVRVSRLKSLLNQQGSKVEFGSLVILPIARSLLYVQPMFVTARNVGIPELKKVILVLGQRVVMGDDFPQALGALFHGRGRPPAAPKAAPPAKPAKGVAARVAELLQRADRLYGQAQRALSRGDFATYGKRIQALGKVLAEARRLSHQNAAPSPSPSPGG